ncbi:unnamed protein product [Lathyrus sativus]|nr:unnamed protein product [Lathyrus sativus]
MTKRGRGRPKTMVPLSSVTLSRSEIQEDESRTTTVPYDDAANNTEDLKIDQSETLMEDVKSMMEERKL